MLRRGSNALLALCFSAIACATKTEAPPPKIAPARIEPAEKAAPAIPACVLDRSAGAACRLYDGTGTAEATIAAKPDADVYAFGKRIGRTPISRHRLPLGCLELIFVTEDGRCVVKQVTIDDGERLAILRFEL